MRRQLQWCAVTMAWLCLSAAGVVHGQCRYEVTAIIEGPSCGIFGKANLELLGMNDLGQACGVMHECAGGAGEWPWVWSEETGLIILPLPEGATSGEAVDINNVLGTDELGQVACTLSGLAIGQRAFLYSDGAWTNLGVLAGDTSSEATSINDDADICGTSHDAFGTTTSRRSFTSHSGTIQEVELPLGPNTSARALNEHATIVGWMGQSSTSISSGFRWNSNVVEVISPLPKADSCAANAVNNREVVVGHSGINLETGPDAIRGWRLVDCQFDALPEIEPFDQVAARLVNDANQIIVVALQFESAPGEVYLWQADELHAIRDLIDPVRDLVFGLDFNAINDRGQIGAIGGIASAAGVILTPADTALGDVNLDCVVDEHDLMAILNDWGTCPKRGSCICDIVTSETFQPPGDGIIDGADLAIILMDWSETNSKPRMQRSER